MFEKEAEEYADEKCGTIETEEKKFCRLDWQRGAKFGYNKANKYAKTIIKDLLDSLETIDGEQVKELEVVKEAKQFLSEVEK